MQATALNYSQTHRQILWDLERFYAERINHYAPHLERLVEAYQAEYDAVVAELTNRGLADQLRETRERRSAPREIPALDPRYVSQLQQSYGLRDLMQGMGARLFGSR